MTTTVYPAKRHKITPRRLGARLALTFCTGLVAALCGCSALASSAGRTKPMVTRVEAACVDRSDSMRPVWTMSALHMWAGEIRRSAASPSPTTRVFVTGFIGAQSYATGFGRLAPVTIPASPAKPSNPYATNSINRWGTHQRAIQRSADRGAALIAAYHPKRQVGTDVAGCILRAHTLGATRLFLATDLMPVGTPQTAPLKLHRTVVTILEFCSTNNAAACQGRAAGWTHRVTQAGATRVSVLVPNQPLQGGLFARR